MKKIMTWTIITILLLSGCNSTQKPIKADGTPTPANEENIEEHRDDYSNVEAEGLFETFSQDELLDDFIEMKNIIETYHPKLYTDHEELNRIYNTIEDEIYGDMTKLEFLRVLSPLVAALNCGHTRIFDNIDTADIKHFADLIYIADDKMYTRDNTFYKEIPLGSEIVSINDRTALEIIDLMKGSLSSDGENETSKYFAMTYWFNIMYLNYVEYAEKFSITYITPDGVTDTVEGSGYSFSEMREMRTSSFGDYVPQSTQFEDNYAVLQMEDFYPYGQYTISFYKTFIDDFFLEVKDKGIENVILDVRGNGGGDPKVTAHLFSYLETEPHPYWIEDVPDYYPGLKDPIPMAENHFDGNLYILINGGCGSSTGHLLALLKYQSAGIFIGEESSASFACTDSSRDTMLKNTDLRFHYSTQVWQVDAPGLTPGRGIMPDYEVVPTIDDIINENDAVLEFAIDLIHNQ